MNFSYLKKNLWELFNILKYYDDIIDVDINKKEINIKKYMLSIPLIKEININEIKKILNIKDMKISPEITFSQKEIDNTIIYYYPKKFYKDEKVNKLLFFFEFFLKEYLSDKEIKKILPDELYNFNHALNYYLGESKYFIDMGSKIIWNKKYNFIDIIKNGYKILEAISEIKNDDIKLKSGITLI